MRIKLVLTALLVSFGSIFVSSAQIDTRIGGGLAYGSEIENIGIGVNGEFGIMDKLSISPSFIFYLPKEEGPVNVSWWEVNGNANYYFIQKEDFSVYGLAGINYTHVKVDYSGSSIYDFEATEGRIGLNIGGGATYDFGSKIIPFAELKYVVIDEGQLVLMAGVKFNI